MINTDLYGNGAANCFLSFFENKKKSKGRKKPLFFFPYTLLKPPMARAKKNTPQTGPWAGALGQRDGQDGTAARAGHDDSAWETEREAPAKS